MKFGLPFVCLLGLLASPLSAAVDVTDLGTLSGGDQSIAFAINESDQIVGLSWTTNGPSHSFLYSNGQMTDLYPLNSQDLITAGPTGINNFGQIASGAIAADGTYYPVLYDARTGEMTTLGSLGGATNHGFSGVATAINNLGQTVGYSYLDSVNRHAFLYEKGTLRDMGCLQGEDEGCTNYAYALNDRGQIVGSTGRAFLYSNGFMSDISPFGSLASYARGINNQGQVVGEYLIADHSAFRAFLYSGGTFTDLGATNSSETVAYDINDRSQIVGASWMQRDDACRDCNEYEPRAFLYENGVMTDLNALLPPGSQWKLLQAFAINNKGRIVGYGLIRGQFHAFMLSIPRIQKTNGVATEQNGRGIQSAWVPNVDAGKLPDAKRIETELGKQFLLEMRGDHHLPSD